MKPQLITSDKIKHSYVSFPARVPAVCSFCFGARLGFSPLPFFKSPPQRSVSDSPPPLPSKWHKRSHFFQILSKTRKNPKQKKKRLSLLPRWCANSRLTEPDSISPQRCVCLRDGWAGVRGRPCLLLQRKRCFLMAVYYTQSAASYSSR